MAEPVFVSRNRACEILSAVLGEKVDPRRIAALAEKGQFTVRKVGGRWYVDLNSLRSYINSL